MAAPIDTQGEGGGIDRNAHVFGLPAMIQHRLEIAHGLLQQIETRQPENNTPQVHDQKWYDTHGADRPK